MYLKQLELLGFKSFPNKTTVKFAEGVTAIVGPNGCGKTNVLDALRWVLGEQKPTLLRGGKMEEVIFNGTRELKPINMAEVTLTVINDRGVLPTEYHEVQITRRLFRNQESEYLLNKVPCRLKDITDLFVDTGMGAHSYSVIQQDMIESVISDKAEERRFLFEEAAGITKYKHRKRAALRKLEATENDFLRLKDIHAEVKTRVNSLSRQQKKAERFVQLREESKDWEVFFGAEKVRILEQEKREIMAEISKLSDERLAKTTAFDSVSAELESGRQAMLECERALAASAQEFFALSEQAHTHEREVSALATVRSHAEQLIDKNSGEIASIEARLDTLATQSAEAQKLLLTEEQSLRQIESQLSEAERYQSEVDRKLLSARTSRESENHRLMELEGKISSGKTEELGLKEQEDELVHSRTNLESLLGDIRPKCDHISDQIAAGTGELEILRQKAAQLENTQTETNREIERLGERIEELTHDASTISAAIEACEARRKLLEDMMLHYEGYDGGIKTAMENRGRWPSISGTVAEKFVPVLGMEVAVEAALGEIAKYLICQDKHSAEGIVTFLRDEKKGRIGILVPNTGVIQAAIKRPEFQLESVVGWLDGFVTCDESLRPLKEAVLSRIIVFKEGTRPEEILERLPYGFSAVSTDGVLYGSNSIAGGSDDRLPLFRRRERVEEQSGLIKEHTLQLERLRDEKNRAQAGIAECRAESGRIATELESIREESDTRQANLANLNFELRSSAVERDRLEKELRTSEEKLTRIKNRQFTLNLGYTQLTTEKDELLQSLSQVGTRLEDVEKSAGEATAEVSRLHVVAIEAKSRHQQIESQLRHLAELASELTQSRLAKQDEVTTARESIQSATSRLETIEQILKSTYADRTRINESQETMRAEQAVLADRISTQEKLIKSIRDERDVINERVHQLEVRLSTITSEQTSIAAKLKDDFDVTIESLDVKRPQSELSDDEARLHLLDLKEKLKAFGAVNLLALEEYQEAFQREQFLDEQIKDLTSAKNDLQQTITKINQTAKWLFAETLSKVQANFSALFVELFNGGEAEIKLENPDDPLESNIEITARPRGKKQLPITMMSGGERALTAISLLFSLYLVKPSPFCILDEIDAPLDDANCRRFLTIIKKFSNQTQFICITHNKITMERANNLYGITMEQPGVSKLVAVRFADLEADGKTVQVRTVSAAELDAGELPWDSDAAGSIEDLPQVVQERLKPKLTLAGEGTDTEPA